MEDGTTITIFDVFISVKKKLFFLLLICLYHKYSRIFLVAFESFRKLSF